MSKKWALPIDTDRKFPDYIWTKKEITEKCQHNAWLKRGGVDFEEDPFMESDYKFGNYYVCYNIKELKEAICFGNWAIRQGFIYESIAFINQINGGDEWWTIKKFPDGKIIAFESMSMKRMIEDHGEDGEKYLADLMAQLIKATKEQCEKLEYTDAEFEKKWDKQSNETVIRVQSSRELSNNLG